MKKLDNLNKEKYLLEPQRMGELVGGQKIVKPSEGGKYVVRGSNKVYECSEDRVTYDNLSDFRRGDASDVQFIITAADQVATSNTSNTYSNNN